MRAFVIATGSAPEMAPLNERYPTPMIPFIDRPFIQHVVEFLIAQGVNQFDFVLNHLPEKIEKLLGDGTRWGVSFRSHLVRDPSKPYGLLKMICIGSSERTESSGEQSDDSADRMIRLGPILLVHADRLADIDLKTYKPPAKLTEPIMFYWQGDDSVRDDSSKRDDGHTRTSEWTGCAWISPWMLESIPGDLDENGLEEHLRSKITDDRLLISLPKPLSVRSFKDILESQQAVLAKRSVELMLAGQEVQDGIWLSRNVVLHPTATLTPPVYIGPDCRIGAGVKLGPNAIIGNDCVLDGRCLVDDSIVFPGSFVGEALELTNVIVDKNSLINVRFGAALSIGEEFILGSMSRRRMIPLIMNGFERLIAVGLLLFLLPILLVTALILKLRRKGPVMYRPELVRLPTQSDPVLWRKFRQCRFSPRLSNINQFVNNVPGSDADPNALRDFFLRFLPGLINVVKGELSFVGVAPRSQEEVELMPLDWKELYIQAKAGLVTEAYIQYGTDLNADEIYSAEAFYAVSAGFRHNCSLLGKYFVRVLTGKGR